MTPDRNVLPGVRITASRRVHSHPGQPARLRPRQEGRAGLRALALVLALVLALASAWLALAWWWEWR